MEASGLDVILVLILIRVSCVTGQKVALVTALVVSVSSNGPQPQIPNGTLGKDTGITAENGGSTAILTCLGLELIAGIGLLVVFAVAVVLGSRRVKRLFTVKTSVNHGDAHHGQQQQHQAADGSLDSLRSTPLMADPVGSTFTPVRGDGDLAYSITEIGPLFIRRSSNDEESDDGMISREDSRPGSSVTKPRGEAKRPCYSPPPPPSPSGHTIAEPLCEPVLQYAQLELVQSNQQTFAAPLRQEKTEYAIILGELQALVKTPLSIYPN